jgi:hypothetical protein
MDTGVPYVMMDGTIVKLRLCVEKLATQEIVSTACEVVRACKVSNSLSPDLKFIFCVTDII